jgi:hypothetical protein
MNPDTNAVIAIEYFPHGRQAMAFYLLEWHFPRSHLINTWVGEALASRPLLSGGRLKPPLHNMGGFSIYEMASSKKRSKIEWGMGAKFRPATIAE